MTIKYIRDVRVRVYKNNGTEWDSGTHVGKSTPAGFNLWPT